MTIMDFPQAWAFVRATKPEDHHVKCSWKVTGGALLCDCNILSDEYERRRIEKSPDPRNESRG